MVSRPVLTGLRAGALLASAATASLTVAACSSSGGAPPHAAGNGTAARTSVATVEVRSGPHGRYLTDGAGRTLYMFASDTATKSTCDSSCLSLWPAFDTSGSPSAGSGVTSADLSTITGTDGKTQVAYAGHPLYYYAADSRVGDTKGQGIDLFGAEWWLLQPSGRPITGAPAAASSSAPASSSGGGGGAWG